MFVALVVVMFALQPVGMELRQLGLTLQTAMPLVLVSAAQCIVLLTAGMDASVGGVLAVTNVLTAVWTGGLEGTASWRIIVIVILGGAMGAINGTLVVFVKVPPFIATIATWSIYDGLALLMLRSAGGATPTSLTEFITSPLAGIPMSILILASVLVAWWWWRGTASFKAIISLGSDDIRAALSGVRVGRATFTAYTLSGFIAGLAGIYLALVTSTGDPTIGDEYLLPSIEAALIGGVSLAGGMGGIGQAVAGALMLTCIGGIISELSLPSWVAIVASAGLLLLVIGLRSRIESKAVNPV
ncbi:MAG: ABC transporter permease [Bifidobacteriaceae bacterium]|jgi:ribose transport system permease protein|nr:ABC transporter permease [Bifidobacteriaceae bacterium]